MNRIVYIYNCVTVIHIYIHTYSYVCFFNAWRKKRSKQNLFPTCDVSLVLKKLARKVQTYPKDIEYRIDKPHWSELPCFIPKYKTSVMPCLELKTTWRLRTTQKKNWEKRRLGRMCDIFLTINGCSPGHSFTWVGTEGIWGFGDFSYSSHFILKITSENQSTSGNFNPNLAAQKHPKQQILLETSVNLINFTSIRIHESWCLMWPNSKELILGTGRHHLSLKSLITNHWYTNNRWKSRV